MKFSLFIALRYLFSKKSTHVINIISAISISGVLVGTMALVVILSVFNGLDELIKTLFHSFDPDIKITLVQGKTFNPANESFEQIKKLSSVKFYAEVLEENALLRIGDKQFVATIKGVDSSFEKMTGIDTMLIGGRFLLNYQGIEFGIMGFGIASALSVNLSYPEPVMVYVPDRKQKILLDPEKSIISKNIYTAGVFSIQQEIDSKYFIVPLNFARQLLQYNNEVSAIELKINDETKIDNTVNEIRNILGKEFNIRTRFQLQESIYKTVKSEKLMGFLILSFILFIASFNIISSIIMLIVEKKKDISTLRSLGANTQTIKTIFLFEGWMISFLGSLAGIMLGVIICFIQDRYGIIPLSGSGSFIIEYYPVKMVIGDLLAVFATVMLIGFVAAWYPVHYITRRQLES